jgi:hypothetical protein
MSLALGAALTALSLNPYAKLQTGGYIGLATVGLGVELFDGVWRNEMLYGHVPASVAGSAQDSLAWKTDARAPVIEFVHGGAPAARWIPAYGGGGLIYNLSRRVFARLPEEYPAKYYPSTALHWELHLGTEIQFGGRGGDAGGTQPEAGNQARRGGHRHAAYLEANMHEIALLALYDNPRYFGASDLLTYTVGYKFLF